LKSSFTYRFVSYAFIVAQAISAVPTASADTPSRPPESSPRQVETATKARELGEAEKHYRRGVQFAEGDGVAQNYTTAGRFYRQAAEAGYAGMPGVPLKVAAPL
jgi:TPR repeat protein